MVVAPRREADMGEPSTQAWHDTQVLPGSKDWHDTAVLSDPQAWHDTAVLVPQRPAVPAGWYADPYDAVGMRFWDGTNWSARTATAAITPRPRRRRSVLLAFVLAVLFGGLALPYALPLPWWARLVIAAGMAFLLGWWVLLLIPLSWPFAVVGVPLLTALLNPRR
jgi:hypothetical protein